MNRAEVLRKLVNDHFDLLIIGGGINGVWMARDAALRGLKVALVEKEDIGSGTSGKTSKLAHGGFRYLEHLQFRLVREALRERSVLLKLAPHLVRPLPFLFPVYQGDKRPAWLIGLGGWLYDRWAGEARLGPWNYLNAAEVLQKEKILAHGLRGGILYYDAQMDDVRLCLEIAIGAAEAGAAISTHLEVTGFEKQDGKIVGTTVKDQLSSETFSIKAKIIVAALGAWGDQLAKLDDPQAEPILRPTKGVHIVTQTPLTEQHAVVISAKKDNRIMFVIPWRGGSLIGTTDTDYFGSPDDVHADREDVDYLLREAKRLFPWADLSEKKITATFAGLRPTIRQLGKHPSAISREHVVRETRRGLLQIAGGKFTTARAVAEQAVDHVVEKIKPSIRVRCRTAEIPLPGGAGINFAEAEKSIPQLAPALGLSEEIVHNLLHLYGGRFMQVIQLAHDRPELKERICPHAPHILAQVAFALQNEFAETLSDILERRLEVSTLPCQGADAAEKVKLYIPADWR